MPWSGAFCLKRTPPLERGRFGCIAVAAFFDFTDSKVHFAFRDTLPLKHFLLLVTKKKEHFFKKSQLDIFILRVFLLNEKSYYPISLHSSYLKKGLPRSNSTQLNQGLTADQYSVWTIIQIPSNLIAKSFRTDIWPVSIIGCISCKTDKLTWAGKWKEGHCSDY